MPCIGRTHAGNASNITGSAATLALPVKPVNPLNANHKTATNYCKTGKTGTVNKNKFGFSFFLKMYRFYGFTMIGTGFTLGVTRFYRFNRQGYDMDRSAAVYTC